MYFKNRTEPSPDELDVYCRRKRKKKCLVMVLGHKKMKDKLSIREGKRSKWKGDDIDHTSTFYP